MQKSLMAASNLQQVISVYICSRNGAPLFCKLSGSNDKRFPFITALAVPSHPGLSRRVFCTSSSGFLSVCLSLSAVSAHSLCVGLCAKNRRDERTTRSDTILCNAFTFVLRLCGCVACTELKSSEKDGREGPMRG